ncbi:MAG: YbaB/EbfC family nucleoid-associated protein [Candidatus Krumholzibacteria bacterium]|nr:YbaB/EbfC family nucleoid-associated protein [Candidatus Krumholzibacteria bacterium]MDH4337308.1 YbaB/EbfC family nucleoid-associated protein [Candidatus Krumholzibacteria bacterium]MDH5269979.1 YbaB/EbfC family nucleoid-associated protein [Candidatus Krumholzibacteria bacterium]
MADFMKMVKQAQQMQAKMAKLEAELENEEVEAASGGGAVTARVNGKQVLLKLSIRDDVFKDGDREMLEDLILAAVNEAHQKAADLARERMSAITGGMKIPGLM